VSGNLFPVGVPPTAMREVEEHEDEVEEHEDEVEEDEVE